MLPLNAAHLSLSRERFLRMFLQESDGGRAVAAGMTCTSCSSSVQAALQAKPGVRSAVVVKEVKKGADTATVEHDDSLTVAVMPRW